MLVVMTGLPCTGKSTIAEAVAQALPAALLSADPIDAALLGSGISPEQRPDISGFEVMKTLAREQVALGLSNVVDAVNPFTLVRRDYAVTAAEFSATLVVIVMVCSDLELHRERVEARVRDGLKAITWEEVERQMGYYEQHEGGALILDAVNSIEQNVAAALSFVESR